MFYVTLDYVVMALQKVAQNGSAVIPISRWGLRIQVMKLSRCPLRLV